MLTTRVEVRVVEVRVEERVVAPVTANVEAICADPPTYRKLPRYRFWETPRPPVITLSNKFISRIIEAEKKSPENTKMKSF